MINLDLSFVIQLVNFLLLIVILNLFLYRPLRRVLEDRREKLAGARSRAEEVDAEVSAKMAEYERRLREMKAQTGAERGELKKEAVRYEAALLEKARTEAAESLSAVKSRVAKEAADARQLLQAEAEKLSAEICEKVLGRSL